MPNTSLPDFTVDNLGEAQYQTSLKLPEGREYVSDSYQILYNPHIIDGEQNQNEKNIAFEIAGPRERLFFRPGSVKAAIVSCGGLCPGINSVIRSIVLHLVNHYGVQDIIGVKFGYNGFISKTQKQANYIQLNPELVENIHRSGGSILGSSRGTPSAESIVDALMKLKVNMLFTIGGDGTLQGADAIYKEVKKRGEPISVIGIPKTIDNDIPFVKRSFGYETAVTKAADAIRSAYIEASGLEKGIGLVKLMGRNAGYIAAQASIVDGHADFCLIPEVSFSLEGKGGLFAQIEAKFKKKNWIVIAVAEGAGQENFSEIEKKYDASGNLILQDIGTYLKKRIQDHFSSSSHPPSIKYIDPSYLVRSAPANASDQILCRRLGQSAVHAAMAGKTGLLIGDWHGRLTHVPLSALSGQEKAIKPEGELWFQVLETTGQVLN